jgi:hypothetical protein
MVTNTAYSDLFHQQWTSTLVLQRLVHVASVAGPVARQCNTCVSHGLPGKWTRLTHQPEAVPFDVVLLREVPAAVRQVCRDGS